MRNGDDQKSAVILAACGIIPVVWLTLQIALMKMQGYSVRETALHFGVTEKAVYRRMDRLKEKLKKFFE